MANNFFKEVRESNINIVKEVSLIDILLKPYRTILESEMEPVLEAPGDEEDTDEPEEDAESEEDIPQETEEEDPVGEEESNEDAEESEETDADEPEGNPDSEEDIPQETDEEDPTDDTPDSEEDPNAEPGDETGDGEEEEESEPTEDSGDSAKTNTEKILTLKLIDNFISLYDSINYSVEKIMALPKTNAHITSIISQTLDNFEEMKKSIFNYILYTYRKSKYEYNLLIYNYYIEAFKVNLVFLYKIRDFSEQTIN